MTIINPAGNQRVPSDSSLYLRGYAFDDALARLRGGRLRWAVGRRLVGRGEAVTATDLTPGSPVVRLVARDRRGRTASSSVRLRVVAAAPFFTTLAPPKGKLSTRAGSVRLRVATNVTATLLAGGRRFTLNRRTKTITVPVTRGSKALKLALGLRSHGRSAGRTLQIARG